MARQKKKTCLYCYTPLNGRRDAKTCSDRCRKRLQRARLLLEQDLGSGQPKTFGYANSAARRINSSQGVAA